MQDEVLRKNFYGFLFFWIQYDITTVLSSLGSEVSSYSSKKLLFSLRIIKTINTMGLNKYYMSETLSSLGNEVGSYNKKLVFSHVNTQIFISLTTALLHRFIIVININDTLMKLVFSQANVQILMLNVEFE
ncbi:Hypothetical_protein [Hexamita inflata]|uniref:Hypothetical_protein n=1 Tax=Hexamita inflata TaxID=28002 RepID=A0AA86TJ80_9EUKA|nr:Hypothetical protein HINF_LOCUS6556 [Hexamita inflata]